MSDQRKKGKRSKTVWLEPEYKRLLEELAATVEGARNESDIIKMAIYELAKSKGINYGRQDG